MNQSNKVKLNEFIAQSKNMHDDTELQSFSVKWRAFLNSLSLEDGKIACLAYFDGIFETLDRIGEDVKDLVENGTEQERQHYFDELEKLKSMPFFTKKMVRV